MSSCTPAKDADTLICSRTEHTNWRRTETCVDMEIRHRVSAAWGNWKTPSAVSCDRKMPVNYSEHGKMYVADTW